MPKDDNPINKKLIGLTSHEAQQRLLQHGRNEIEEKKPHQLIKLLKKFWAPIPWMLEIAIILQLIIGKIDEAIIIGILLLFNSFLGFFQEGRATKTLALLKHHLAIQTRVLRDNQWQLLPAQELVPGDIVHLRMGDISPADIRLADGKVLIDQSILTGEALPIESEMGTIAYSGALIKRGEATGEVIATGKNTYFGKSAELIQTAKPISHIKKIIFTIVRYLVVIDIVLAVIVFIYALFIKLPITDVIPFILILIVASIPVALPATFTLATAFGATQLARRGVLVTHLLAVEDAATMDVVCCDKTGTITENQLQVAELKCFNAYTENKLLSLAAIACDEATQDPIDKAILAFIQTRGLAESIPRRLEFVPFDPAIKRSEGIFQLDNQQWRVLIGAPEFITKLISSLPDITQTLSQMAEKGYRILAIAIGNNDDKTKNSFELAGLIAFQDLPRKDSKSLIKSLKLLGLKIFMVSGDGLLTSKTIATHVDIGTKACSSQILQNKTPQNLLDCDVFANMFPEDKFRLVQALQRNGHIVGMTGDGVNDAPALKQAEVGIAVANATDIAKAAASIVLTQPGLSGILSAVETSRRIYQRMLTYILNKVIKSFEIAIFLSLGVILTGKLIITPLLIVLLLFTNDFVSMSIATDNVTFSHKPERWQISHLMAAGGILAVLMLLLSFAVFYFAQNVLHLALPQLQTLIFVLLVFTGQGNVYLVRERNHFWHSLPGKWLILASVIDIIIVIIFASKGILMTAINPFIPLALLLVVVFYLFMIDFCKIRIFSYFKLH
jgi:H+-transporting ATPase